MVAVPEAHVVSLGAPWYAPSAPANVAMHRYLDTGFVAQFQADVGNAPQNHPELFDWMDEDRLPAPSAMLKLRRPLHRTFYMVAWEACCKIGGAPALGPEKIASAGFVLRSGNAAQQQGFQIAGGRPQGWADVVDLNADPDAARQIKALGLVPQSATPNPGYTGEETFPLHPLAVQDGTTPHTLLYGYLPIGGGSFVPPAPPALVDSDQSLLPDLSWPFGLAGFSNGPPTVYASDAQITGGQTTSAMAGLLRVLLGRFQLADPTAWSDPQNAQLISVLSALNFYADPSPPGLTGQDLRNWAAAHPATGSTLAALLLDYANTSAANGTVAQAFLATLMNTDLTSGVTLPPSQYLQSGAGNLLVVEADASRLRSALRARIVQSYATPVSALPTPKLISGPAGSYFVVPFVRTICPNGCERINWGQPCDPFAVAAAFDPDAARPSLIEMPSLADAKKGAARGASFDMPPDLADLMNGLNSNAAVQNMWSGGGGPSGGLGIRFICSFSLPVITICAMIMLSIILNLLNIFLGWMAWVKICLPVPVKK